MKLENKNVVITGAALGMGGTITRQLAAEGANLVLVARTPGPLEKLAEELKAAGTRALALPCDVTDEERVKNRFAEVTDFFDGRIDVLINAAGATGPIETPVWKIMGEEFESLLRKNIVGTFLPMKYAIPSMIEHRYGKIVNIGGGSGMKGYRYRAGYSSSKWGVRGLTRTAALDCGEHNINVNAIMPGIVETPRMEKLCHEKAKTKGTSYEQEYADYVAEMALKRVTTPQDIANAVVFLACDDSKNITGQEMVICGGWAV
ncbi:MAG: SDR family NAD(P)-dependent oxidoreductase [Arenicellales bacterium]|jgi:3-oxoacyl-[acyl-carrier protein] reductase|nr:SDR family NAD(P)-dependent oxidoreductase [Arenicellales bacterium]|tara:strand:+ start:1244 stop:2026 length:783 start_codon:yes stop_codon:yes gene_type:complete